MLKDAVAKSSYLQFVVGTRYCFKYANDFAEIHISALNSVDALTLLRCVVHPSKQTGNNRDGSLEDDHLKGIAPKNLIPDDFCSVGLTYLQKKHSQSQDFSSTLQLFDAHLKCYGILDEGVNNWIKMLEEAYNYQGYSHTHLKEALAIAQRCNKVRKYRKEAD